MILEVTWRRMSSIFFIFFLKKEAAGVQMRGRKRRRVWGWGSVNKWRVISLCMPSLSRAQQLSKLDQNISWETKLLSVSQQKQTWRHTSRRLFLPPFFSFFVSLMTRLIREFSKLFSHPSGSIIGEWSLREPRSFPPTYSWENDSSSLGEESFLSHKHPHTFFRKPLILFHVCFIYVFIPPSFVFPLFRET